MNWTLGRPTRAPAAPLGGLSARDGCNRCKRWPIYLIALAIAGHATPTWGDQQLAAPSTEQRGPEPDALATAAAIGPGFFWPGLGARLAGDREGGKHLARLKLLGLTVLLAGGVPFAATGASRHTSGVTVPLLLAGSGAFFGAWWADIYGAATGGREATARTALPPLELELGYGYVYDPQFDYSQFAVGRASGRFGRWMGDLRAWIATDDNTQRMELTSAYRLFGPAPQAPTTLMGTADGTFLDLAITAIVHRQPGDGFSVYTPALSAKGRLDMARIGRSLRGSFLDLSLGLGLEVYDIDGGSPSAVALQLARLGYGLYIGRAGARYGEIVAYYNHRHDELAAGLGSGGVFDGPWGRFGVDGFYFLTPRWGLSAAFEVGSAYVTRLSARVAWGQP